MKTATEIKNEIAATIAAGRKMNNLQNEGGSGCDHTNRARIAELKRELEEIEWSKEATAAKRAIFNSEIKAAAVGGKVTPKAIANVTKKTGIDMATLKLYVKKHNL